MITPKIKLYFASLISSSYGHTPALPALFPGHPCQTGKRDSAHYEGF